jgi:hypothetical protein
MLSMTGLRLFLHKLRLHDYRLYSGKSDRFIIVGEEEEGNRVAQLLKKVMTNAGFVGLVKSGDGPVDRNGFIGNISQVREIIKVYEIDEVIFCAKDIAAQEIIDQMSALRESEVNFKIAPPESLSIIGSNSINTAGDLYVIDINSINKINNRRNKRVFDVLSSMVLMLSYPFTVIIVRRPLGFLSNIVMVLAGRKSWTGYHPTDNADHKLPGIREGVLHPTDAFPPGSLDDQTASRLNILYARDYKLSGEFRLLIKGFRNLGRK